MMDASLIFIFLIFLLNGHNCNLHRIKCPLYQMHFQKIIGFRPSLEYITNFNLLFSPIAIYDDNTTTSSERLEGVDVVAGCNSHIIRPICWKLCHDDETCIAYVHFIDTNECYGFTFLNKSLRYRSIRSDIELIADPNAIFYEKICLKVPEDCKRRLWTLTKIPGTGLVNQGRKALSILVTRRECAEKCLYETEFSCLSASFVPSYKNNRWRRFHSQVVTMKNNETLGRCILSDKDKMIQPDAFRAAPFDEEYIENQCHDRPIENDSCAYELYSNSSFIYAEATVSGLTQKECQMCCSHETRFYCQGASYVYNHQDISKSECSLHSEDIISMGPRSIKMKSKSVYMRRVKCLDVSVICNSDEMAIKYNPKDWFRGKMYVSSHSEDCATLGNGTRSAILRLPIGSETKERRCGILRAYEVTKDFQRIFISALVVIQNNLHVQSQGDRLIKVGCIISNLTTDPLFDSTETDDISNTIALESSLAFTQSEISNEGSIFINTTNGYHSLPKIKLQVIDLNSNIETKDVKIGQNLELQIIANLTETNAYDFRASSLVVKGHSKKNYVLLIDEKGCPTDATIFPALTRSRTEKQNILRARFHAFKFAGTSLVNFDVKIHFCPYRCPEDNCLPYFDRSQYIDASISNDDSYVRNRRQGPALQEFQVKSPIYVSTIVTAIDENNFNKQRKNDFDKSTDTKTQHIITNETTLNNSSLDLELPLNYDLNVRGPNVDNTNGLIYNERGILLIARIDPNPENICLHQSLLIALLIFWLIFQIVLMFSCCFIIQKYKRLAQFEVNRRKLQESMEYLESRRVHWADQGGYTL